MEKPALWGAGEGSKAEVGKVGGRCLLGFTGSTAAREVFGTVLAKGARVPGANHSENRGDLAGALAFAHHSEGNFSRANLCRFLRWRKQEVVERLARLRECEQKRGLLRDFAVGLHGGGGAFGAGGGLFVGSHRMSFVLAVGKVGRNCPSMRLI